MATFDQLPAEQRAILELVIQRRQAAPGVKISTKAFGRDRRMPITNRWRGSA